MRSLLFLVLLFAAGTLKATPLPVFVSVLPQQMFVEAIGGDAVAVQVLVGTGISPEHFEPGARQMVALAEASLYVRAGMPFEESWLPRIRQLNPSLRILDMRSGVALRAAVADDHGHGADGIDPHVWTDPRRMRQHARLLRDILQELLPVTLGPELEVNWRALDDRLAVLDEELETELAPLQQRRFLALHPAWGYFAERYGVEQVAIQAGDKEPGPRRLADLVAAAREQGIGLMVVQPQHDVRTAEVVARELDVRLVSVDPLDPDYFAALRKLAAALAGKIQ